MFQVSPSRLKDVEFSYKDVMLAELECKELAHRHTAQIMLGNFGNWDWTRVFVKCMEDRGFKFANSDELRR